MRGTWKLKAVRQDFSRSPVRRPNASETLIGTVDDALEFIARAQEHLLPKGITRVEAWSDQLEFDFLSDLAPSHVTFRLRPHPNGRDWLADQNELHHGGWFLKLRDAIDYTLFRGRGTRCEIQVLDASGAIKSVIVADQSKQEATPCIPASLNFNAASHREASP